MCIIEIEKLDHQGRGIGRLYNKVIFVDQALSEEKVKVEIVSEKNKYYEGKIIEIIKKSQERITSKCPYFLECGGCDLQHVSYETQLKFKQSKVLEILTKYSNISNIDKIIKPIVKSEKQFNYRNKVTFQVKEKIGFYKRKSYELIAVDRCDLISEKMNEILKIVRENLDLKYVKQVIIKDMGNYQSMLTIYLHKSISVDEFLQKTGQKIENIIIYVENKLYKQKGKSNIIAKLYNFDFLVSSTSFFQVNLDQTIKLYDKIIEYCNLNDDDYLLDLYCGTGTIGICLSKYCKQVLGIEINKEAIKNALENKKINSISNIDFISSDVKDVINKIKFKPDVIVVDPPRSGLNNNVINDIIRIKPKKLIYVSCDPITLARDLSILKDCYDIVEVTPIDMFPQTEHVECVCVLNRR